MRVHLKVLIVFDSRVQLGYDRYSFGLGPVIDTLRFWVVDWARIHVFVVDRDIQSAPIAYPGVLARDVRRRHPFRFDEPGFDLDDYDQLWLFGDRPASTVDDDPESDSEISLFGLSDDELRVIAEWMDRGGGVFATGDHGILGASLSSRLPRVRKMRRWTHAQGVPRGTGLTQHQTLNFRDAEPGSETEMDAHPQPLYPVDQGGGPHVGQLVPHPLLCGLDGPIDCFPDHMHEGAVFEDDEVRLDDPLDIAGYLGVEFPVAPVDPSSPTLPPFRPVPKVVAHVFTTDSQHKRFPALGVWDGDPVGRGRIVVDSTWHHWFSMNVLPLADDNVPAYRAVQQFQRNVAVWLATPEQRRVMLITAIWNALLNAEPMRFIRALPIKQFGARALDVIGREVPHCVVSELVQSFDDPLARTQSPAMARGLEPGTVDAVVVGGIGQRLLELTGEHLERLQSGHRPQVELERIQEAAVAGVHDARSELVAEVDEALAAIEGLRSRYDGPVAPASTNRRPSVTGPLGPVAIVVERVEPADGNDPLLTDHTARLRLLVQLGWSRLFDDVVELGGPPRQVARVIAEPGEELTLSATATVDDLAGDAIECFTDTLVDDADTWIGRHIPDPGHRVRIWYRVEHSPAD